MTRPILQKKSKKTILFHVMLFGTADLRIVFVS